MISKKVRELFVSLMEATDDSAVSYDGETEQYSGFFNSTVVDKYIELFARPRTAQINHTPTTTPIRLPFLLALNTFIK